MGRLEDKVAVVTGATRGIGLAIATRFLAEGAKVVSVGRSFDNEQHANDSGERFTRDAYLHLPGNVCEEADWTHIFDSAISTFGGVDILVNNAGQIAYDPLEELTTEAWAQIVAANQTGPWLGMRKAIPHMRTRGGGAIINVVSIWGVAAVGGAHAYHATKGALRMMTKNAAITYADDSIRVNSLIPGFIDTPLTEAQDAAVNEYVVGQTPMGRSGTPDEIAAGAIFLAGDESSFMTGSELVIDGGYLAQ
ncbi:SDR family NAD(P)-dependent oxidoreductase [Brevibacterium marinum]|uniref:NAD(P)-dependent dehydrogenase (Short-subunit alcohol dehydrogenase family) n=1 Tax=Brevibacterium marinum TaxID=418643 RepID=A0A846S543_9MICO|nr:glucose 1-dehydrogenase [Brevibacterium marinum]NJC58750.1 NAD(P)-dependent dehydrogenase (short-subunit alcohol dehydrogenase family) [Brevibacterium marinum]